MEGGLVTAVVLWIALWRWRSWGALAFFTLVLATIQTVFGYLSNSAAPEAAGWPWYMVLAATLVDVSVNVGIFAAVGAIIVWLRGGKFERKVSEADIDAELARVRAEAAARNDRQPSE